MIAATLRCNALERVLLPSGAWIDRHPWAALAGIAVLLLISGAF